jgi:uncharacterized protein YbjT (DUF2867 family)
VRDRILVTGATGLLGQLVVKRLHDKADEVRIMSRKAQTSSGNGRYTRVTADLRSGHRVPDAVADINVIVHCATAYGRGSETQITDTVLKAAQQAGASHLVYISIVGVDCVPLGYYQDKLAAERLIAQSGLPYTILRATQFHDLLRTLFATAAKAPVMLVPDFCIQPIDASEVADRLADLAVGQPAGRAPDVAGPQVCHARDFAHAFLLAARRRRWVLPVRLPGKVFRAYRDGGHLAPQQAVGTITFEDYLAAHPDPLTTSYQGPR